MFMIIFQDDEAHAALVEYVEGFAAMTGAQVEVTRTITIKTEDPRIAVEIERLRNAGKMPVLATTFS